MYNREKLNLNYNPILRNSIGNDKWIESKPTENNIILKIQSKWNELLTFYWFIQRIDSFSRAPFHRYFNRDKRLF